MQTFSVITEPINQTRRTQSAASRDCGFTLVSCLSSLNSGSAVHNSGECAESSANRMSVCPLLLTTNERCPDAGITLSLLYQFPAAAVLRFISYTPSCFPFRHE